VPTNRGHSRIIWLNNPEGHPWIHQSTSIRLTHGGCVLTQSGAHIDAGRHMHWWSFTAADKRLLVMTSIHEAYYIETKGKHLRMIEPAATIQSSSWFDWGSGASTQREFLEPSLGEYPCFKLSDSMRSKKMGVHGPGPSWTVEILWAIRNRRRLDEWVWQIGGQSSVREINRMVWNWDKEDLPEKSSRPAQSGATQAQSSAWTAQRLVEIVNVELTQSGHTDVVSRRSTGGDWREWGVRLTLQGAGLTLKTDADWGSDVCAAVTLT
jgi:hypothetical protein